MKKKMVTALLAVSMLAGLSAVNVMAADDDTITVGFSQVGAESDWRTANTESMKSTFSEENGYELIFDDAQQKQENQLTAIRNFIQQEVDYIVLAPVTETGWDTWPSMEACEVHSMSMEFFAEPWADGFFGP